ncbi:unnamed protein product [Linum tenue]|uniref:Alpha 1,4-glycosyltransferase domain-containing protein n=1 Tax=Linum tenue TaxID=586396 RepID=A0AAV0PKX5_9ROSI|nr:unnamed protein product [Linum tenue]
MVSPTEFSLPAFPKMLKKMYKKMFDLRKVFHGPKTPIFSAITFAAIFFMLYSGHLFAGPSSTGSTALQEPALPAVSELPQLNTHMNINREDYDDDESEVVDPLVPPQNVTIAERIEWFRRKLPELDLLNSNELSEKFHGRVMEFFNNNNCSVQFYMVWLSPAKTFGPREFMSMDSLFHSNPEACLIIVSRSMDSKRGYTKLKPVLDLGFKVLAVTPDVPFLVQDTPGEDWLEDMKSGTRDPGYIPLTINLTNLIRIAMIYKYGGAYIDTDFIVLRDFSELRNVVGAQTMDRMTNQWSSINNAVVVFDLGHPMLLEFIKEFSNTFNGNKWGYNGPAMFSRVCQRMGGSLPSYNVTILQPKAFYPVDWIQIRRLFRKPTTGSQSRWADRLMVELQDSYALHLWNKRSRKLIIEDGSVMDRLISEHCVVCQHINHA